MSLRLDYYNSLLASESGRRVYYDLQRMAHLWFRAGGDEAANMSEPEALAQCVLDEFMMRIAERCGIDSPEAEMKMITYQAQMAAESLDIEESEPEKKNLHETND